MYYAIKNNKTGKTLAKKFVKLETAKQNCALMNWNSSYSTYSVIKVLHNDLPHNKLR